MRGAGDAIQDAIVTQQKRAFCDSRQSGFSRQSRGVAHGFSSSGATVFVEPLEAIEANNELQNLKGKEEREIARILFRLTEDLREQLPAIEAAVEAVARTRFYQSKSRIRPKIQSDCAENFRR